MRLRCTPAAGRIRLSPAFIAAAAMLSPAVTADARAPLDADGAIARATRFLQDVARLSPMPVGTDPDHAQAWPRSDTSVLHTPDGKTIVSARAHVLTTAAGPMSGDPRFGSYWRASWDTEIFVDVCARDGSICGLVDGALNTALLAEGVPELPVCVSAETAVARACLYLQAAGIRTGDLAVVSVRLQGGGVPRGSVGFREWVVEIRRLCQGVPYHDQRVTVWLEAAHGRLRALGAFGATDPPPSSAVVSVSAEAAAANAGATVGPHGYQAQTPWCVSLKVAHPTDYYAGKWYETPIRPNRAADPRLVWVALAPVTDPRGQTALAEVWTDAATGQVAGGEVMYARGTLAVDRAAWEAAAALASAIRVEARPVAGGKPLTLDLKADAVRLRGALSGIRPVQEADTRAAPFHATHLLTATLPGGKTLRLECDRAAQFLADGKGTRLFAPPVLCKLLAPSLGAR